MSEEKAEQLGDSPDLPPPAADYLGWYLWVASFVFVWVTCIASLARNPVPTFFWGTLAVWLAARAASRTKSQK